MNKKKFVFGIKDLDRRFKNTLTEGSTVLVAGHPGVGKTTFAATICHENAKSGSTCLYISLDERREYVAY